MQHDGFAHARPLDMGAIVMTRGICQEPLAAFIVVVALGSAAPGCGKDLPQQDPRLHVCVGQIQSDYLGDKVVAASYPGTHNFSFCADVGALTFVEQLDVCDTLCKDEICFFNIHLPGSYKSFGDPLCDSCATQSVGVHTDIGCPTASIPTTSGFGFYSVALTGTASVDVDGDVGTTQATGVIKYTISDVLPTRFDIDELNVTAGNFEVDGTDITNLNIQLAKLTLDAVHSKTDDTFSIAPGKLCLTTNFQVDGDPASVSFCNPVQVDGIASPDSDVFLLPTTTFNFEIEGTATTVTFDLQGVHTNRPPVAVVQPESPVECNIPNGADLTLDGSASSDPESNIDVLEWYVDDNAIPGGRAPNVDTTLSLGNHVVQLDIRDTLMAMDIAIVPMDVVDTTPPELAISVSPSCLWAPNHKMVLFELGNGFDAEVSDVCDPTPTFKVTNVTSSQPETAGGSGNTSPDFLFGDLAFCLRSERDGTQLAPREYEVTVVATDASNVTTTKTVVVKVGHDKSNLPCKNVSRARVVADDDPRCEGK